MQISGDANRSGELAMQDGSMVKQRGQVEVDETFIGGKARNMHKGKRKANGTGPVAMTPVQGLLERSMRKRGSQVRAFVISDTKSASVQNNVRKYVLRGAEVHTDELKGYQGLDDTFTPQVINHAVSYVRGHVHVNGLENFWSLLKRTIRGTYVSVEPFHLFRYPDEQAFRLNERKDADGDRGRFLTAMAGIIGKPLTWKKLRQRRKFKRGPKTKAHKKCFLRLANALKFAKAGGIKK